MKIKIVSRDGSKKTIKNVLRVEASGIVDGHGERFNAILLDADDTFDVLLEYPEGIREELRSIVKEGEYLGN